MIITIILVFGAALLIGLGAIGAWCYIAIRERRQK